MEKDTIKLVHYLKEGRSVSSQDQAGRYMTQCGLRRASVTIEKARVSCPDCLNTREVIGE
ncbi:hypothetical protein LCGC14_0476960 [marine sediment metagenome]|uniref:Uncharacterized protein n=1 Tax=marine sediment metagenome TaxID=412755 RepID=A0A0F9SFR4_9ZZZZ